MPPKSSSRLKFPKRVPKLCHIGHQIVPKCTRPAPKCTRPALLLSSRNHAGTTPPLNVLLRRNHRQLECRAVGTMWNHAGTTPPLNVLLRWNHRQRERRAVGTMWNHAGTTPPMNVLLKRNHRQCECRAVGTMWNHAGTTPSFDRFAETKPSVCNLWEPHGTTLEPHRNQAVSKEALSEMHTYGCRPDINIYY